MDWSMQTFLDNATKIRVMPPTLSQSEKNEHPLTPRFCDEKEWCEFFRNSVKPSVMFSCATFFSDVVFGNSAATYRHVFLHAHIYNMYMFYVFAHMFIRCFSPMFVCAPWFVYSLYFMPNAARKFTVGHTCVYAHHCFLYVSRCTLATCVMPCLKAPPIYKNCVSLLMLVYR